MQIGKKKPMAMQAMKEMGINITPVAAGAGSGGAAARPRQGLAPGAAPSESARLRVRMKSAGCQLSAILAEIVDLGRVRFIEEGAESVPVRDTGLI